MGLFGSAPKYPTIKAPEITGGNDVYGNAQGWLKNSGYGNLLSAQSDALSNANDPNYYAKFQPTSFEQALGNQSFQNVWPDQQAFMQNQLSKSGMAYSPVAAATLGKAYGNTAFNIGSYLDQQGSNRANNAIQAGLNINPMNYLNPVAQMGADQGNLQQNYNFQVQKQNADANYANAMQKYNQQQQLYSLGGQLVGGAAGAFLGGPGGAMMGSQLGGALMGGGQDMGQGLMASQGMPSSWGSMFGGGSGGKSAQPVYGSMTNNAMSSPSMFGMGDMLKNFGGGSMMMPPIG